MDNKPLMDQHASGFIRCAIYTDMLANGIKSPGFVPLNDRNGFPGVWVAPISAVQSRSIRGITNSELFSDSPQAQARWAADNVRLVQIKYLGSIFRPEIENYEVIVPAPFATATFGFLDLKRGKEIEIAVSAGDTIDRSLTKSMTNTDIPLQSRIKAALTHFMTQNGSYRGTAGQVNQIKFPRLGDNWS